ncbi:MAG: hypothetical protein LBG99_07505 [Propionibacteriaceae bacterium]|jgi:2-keto-3-deoxy-L-rhamnonate aldolase RhmA|nr:hypothetical protein [Propionibacteriaceae bacterium]
MNRKFRNKVRSREFLLGTWATTSDPAMMEAMGQSDLEFIIIDAEHGPYSPETLQTCLMALTPYPVGVFVRVGSLEPIDLMRPLDMGADGIIIPRVNSAEEVEHIVRWTRYPPIGVRGYGPRRAASYCRFEKEYVAASEDHIAIVPMVETAGAAKELEKMAAVPGIDGLLVGRNDLSGSIGLEWQPTHPTVMGIVERVVKACADNGIASGIASGYTHENVRVWDEMGLTMVAAGLDYEWMKIAADDLASYERLPRG